MKLLFSLLFLCTAVWMPAQDASPASERTAIEFKDGDKLVLLGNTVFEREQRYGAFEPRLALALGETKVSVRNLAWSGDTVFGHARSYFGPPEEGLQRLSGHLEMLKPTVVMLCYGSELAFERLKGLPDFLTGYRSLIDLIRAKSPGVRIVVAPHQRHRDTGMLRSPGGQRTLHRGRLRRRGMEQVAEEDQLLRAVEQFRPVAS